MARTTKGRLFKRGKQGRYYLQYYVNGQEFKEVLRDGHGEPITTEREARKAADLILAPIRYRNDAQRLRAVVNELATAEDKAELAAAELKNKTATIANGWKVYVTCPSCPDATRKYSAMDKPPTHTYPYVLYCYFVDFQKWIAATHKTALLFSDVSEDMAAEYFEYLKANSPEFTANAKINTIKSIYRVLIEDEKITVKRDPFKRIRLIKRHPNSKKPLTVEQIGRLISTATGEVRVLIALGYFTGLRLGDCATLSWGEVDLIRGVIERIPNKMRDRVADLEQIRVKIGIAPFLLNLLLDLPGDRTGYVLPELASRYSKRSAAHFDRVINPLFKACGIETRVPGTGKEHGTPAVVQHGFHSLRYSYISHNAEAGTPAAIIQRNAGHANPAMTAHYTKISDAAAVKYATALQLPAPEAATAEVIDVLPVEPERAELHRLADTLTPEEIKKILAFIGNN